MSKPGRRIAEQPTPLIFNNIYGKGLTMTDDFRKVTRATGFGDAIVFSNRQVRSYEKIYLRHRQKQVDWIGSLRVGFCVEDPVNKYTQETLPNLAFRNMTDKDGYYLRACPDELLLNSPIIYVYYSFDGQVHLGAYGKAGSDQVVLTINDHTAPFFFFAEVYGRTDQIEIIDPSTLAVELSEAEKLLLSYSKPIAETIREKLKIDQNFLRLLNFAYLMPQFPSKFLSFVKSKSHNNKNLEDRRILCVDNLKVRATYGFVSKPIEPGQTLICRVLSADFSNLPKLLFGLTDIDPKSIQNEFLPIETEELVQKFSSSDWFIDPNIDCEIETFDELAFSFNYQGEVRLSINNKKSFPLRINVPSSAVNQSTLYPFFDLYGQVTSICLFNYVDENYLRFSENENRLKLCAICCENLGDTRLLPCQCIVCGVCAATLKRPGTLSDCPFDRKHISRTEKLI